MLDVEAALGLEVAEAGAVVGCGSSEGDRRSLSTGFKDRFNVFRELLD